MTLLDLQIHLERLLEVRAEVRGQGDEPPPALAARIRRVQMLLREVEQRRAAVRERKEAERDGPELELADVGY